MNHSLLAETAAWALAHGYGLMFLLMLVEGPAITAAGAFVAAIGYFNVWLVLLLSVLGNLIPDALYYAIGFCGRQKLLDKYGHYLRVTPERVARLEKLYREHVGKTIAVVKLVSILATPGLIIAGVARVPLKKYVWWSLIITMPTSLFYLALGYYFGAAYDKIARYADYGVYFIAASIAVFIAVSYLYKKYSKKLAGWMEKI